MIWSPEPGADGGRPIRAAAGFTLIELLVVIAIMGFALVLITGYRPLWSAGLGLEGTAAELASGLRLARSEAIASDRPVEFAVDPHFHRYQIGRGAVRPLPANMSIALLTLAGERQAPNVAGIRFNPDGSSSGGRITLGIAHRRVAVGVDWLTGRVTVADVR